MLSLHHFVNEWINNYSSPFLITSDPIPITLCCSYFNYCIRKFHNEDWMQKIHRKIVFKALKWWNDKTILFFFIPFAHHWLQRLIWSAPITLREWWRKKKRKRRKSWLNRNYLGCYVCTFSITKCLTNVKKAIELISKQQQAKRFEMIWVVHVTSIGRCLYNAVSVVHDVRKSESIRIDLINYSKDSLCVKTTHISRLELCTAHTNC